MPLTPAAMIRLLKKTASSASRATTARTKSSFPAWLNNLAKANNINFSSVLQNALCRELHIQST